MSNKIVIGDADSLVALVYKADSNHLRALKISQQLLAQGYAVVYPNTAILEAITALKRALNLAAEAELINTQYQSESFAVQYISQEIQTRASHRFSKTNSKKNTIFDAVVVETAVELGAEYIFSFDSWYPKVGFRLAEFSDQG